MTMGAIIIGKGAGLLARPLHEIRIAARNCHRVAYGGRGFLSSPIRQGGQAPALVACPQSCMTSLLSSTKAKAREGLRPKSQITPR